MTPTDGFVKYTIVSGTALHQASQWKEQTNDNSEKHYCSLNLPVPGILEDSGPCYSAS